MERERHPDLAQLESFPTTDDILGRTSGGIDIERRRPCPPANVFKGRRHAV